MAQEGDVYLFFAMVCLVIWIIWVFRPRRFKGGLFFDANLNLTEMVLHDSAVAWEKLPSGLEGNWVDLGYDFDGNLVAIRIWDDVRYRNKFGIMRKNT
jgi:hypothetical protein